MQSDHQFYPRKEPPLVNQVGNNYMHVPVASAFGAVLPPGSKHLKPFHDVELQSSEVCPKNFIIFDQTDHHSQIMYNPAMAHRFNTPGLNIHSTYFHDNFGGKEINDVTEMSSPLEEDSDDIDALLSSEEDEEEEEEEQAEYDEEEVSTARTYGNYGSSSPESCSTYGSKARKNRASSSVQKSSGNSGSSCNSERKRQRVKKMVRALRGIVPGGNQMNSVTVLDEAVRYLKSLKVEVQKLGVGNLKN
ncbi:transcription factor bHLH144 [Ziziphus jujuba]|nr:transcription factor bHLH144 [Ziziphus jujuba]XP_048334448.1 transcription factor bHLH144 [Ziziphus jujuba]XP_048334454.1 transcription factor bHLH144 [Ziziphus jujuba]XP_048334462.1 transcription factor bHLH144 [Ziziphus jujuba]XP_048334471.1 transcription factor bHLH144 [Ziziphus jujuba]